MNLGIDSSGGISARLQIPISKGNQEGIHAAKLDKLKPTENAVTSSVAVQNWLYHSQKKAVDVL